MRRGLPYFLILKALLILYLGAGITQAQELPLEGNPNESNNNNI